MAFRDSASFGKRQEYRAVAELLARKFDVYMTLVDDQGIDCVVRLPGRRYVDLQIKARSKSAVYSSVFAAMTFSPRSNYWFIFFTEKTGHFWTIPSKDVAKFSHRNHAGKNAGKRHLKLPTRNSGVVWDRFAPYANNAGFELLRKFRG